MTAPVGDVTTPIIARQEGQLALAIRAEQAFGGERSATLVEQRHQRSLARQLHPLDDDLVLGPARIGGQFPGRDDLGSILGPKGERLRGTAPDHCIHAGAFVFQGEVAVA